MVMHRRAFVTLAFTAIQPSWGLAQVTYPLRPIKLIVPFAPGGGADFMARVTATQLGERLGQPVLVENRPGAASVLGNEMAIKSAPDGYTLLLVSGSYTVNPSLYKLKFDPISDITPIIQLSRGGYVLAVHPQVKAQNLSELLALCRSSPEKMSYASSGQGGHLQIVTEYMLRLAGVRATHVPYRGTGPALNDLLAGNVTMMFGGTEALMQHVKAGKLRALAVGTAQRLSAYPDIPTIAEAGLPGYETISWHGLAAPKGTPRQIIDRLNTELNAMLLTKELRDRIEPAGVEPAGGTPEQFLGLLKTEIERYGAVIRDAGIKVAN